MIADPRLGGAWSRLECEKKEPGKRGGMEKVLARTEKGKGPQIRQRQEREYCRNQQEEGEAKGVGHHIGTKKREADARRQKKKGGGARHVWQPGKTLGKL